MLRFPLFERYGVVALGNIYKSFGATPGCLTMFNYSNLILLLLRGLKCLMLIAPNGTFGIPIEQKCNDVHFSTLKNVMILNNIET